MNPTAPSERALATINAWKCKLLDLSKRNRALNFKVNKVSTVTVIDELPTEIYELLCRQNKPLKFKPSDEPETNLGTFAHADFIHGLPEMNVIFEAPMPEDYVRSAEILRKYDDANIDFVDACIVAMAERLHITRILTIDRRHFGIFKPSHCDSFEILP